MSDAYITATGIAIQTFLYLLAGYAIYVRNESKLSSSSEHLADEVGEMKIELKKLAEVVTVQAVQTSRLDNMSSWITSIERRVEDLRRGNGFVQGRAGIDGEYGTKA